MKKNAFRLLYASAIMLQLTSCTKEEAFEEIAKVQDVLGAGNLSDQAQKDYQLINADGNKSTITAITKDTTFKKGNYTLTGTLYVAPGATLSIEAGSTITIDKEKGDAAVVVLQGAKVNFTGTADAPIVFTTTTKKGGDWGGIIVYGKAPINANGGKSTSKSEDGRNLEYGGTDTTDSSGTLKFVRVEYAGSKIGDGTKENNGFSMYSVGSGTTFDYCVAYKGFDDGVEFYGGSVSCTNFVSYQNADDSFDWQDGWQGKGKNWFAYQTGIANYGIEVEASGNNNEFYPTVENITLIKAAGTNPEDPAEPQMGAIQFKKQGNGHFSNIWIEGYKNLTRTSDSKVFKAFPILIQEQSTSDKQIAGGKLKVTNVSVKECDNTTVGTGFDAQSEKTPPAVPVTFANTNWYLFGTTATKVSLPKGAWANVDGKDLLSAL